MLCSELRQMVDCGIYPIIIFHAAISCTHLLPTVRHLFYTIIAILLIQQKAAATSLMKSTVIQYQLYRLGKAYLLQCVKNNPQVGESLNVRVYTSDYCKQIISFVWSLQLLSCLCFIFLFSACLTLSRCIFSPVG